MIDATAVAHCFCYRQQQAAASAVIVIPADSREVSSSTTYSRWFRLFSSFACSTHSDVYLGGRRSAVGIIAHEKLGRKIVNSKAAAAAARPPQPIERAAVGAVGSCGRSFAYTTRTVYLAVQKLRCRHLLQKNGSKRLKYFNRHKVPLCGRSAVLYYCTVLLLSLIHI